MTEKAHNARKARGSARKWRRKSWNALGEDAPLASFIPATPARHLSPDFDRGALCWKIAERTSIETMPRMRSNPTNRAYRVIAPAQRNRPIRLIPFNGLDR
jgi:hypothetical protein